ncbi:unnamed protein product [Knipowitschia caucasica]
MTMQFEFPKIDWEAADLYQEFQRFRSHVGFVFAGPLSARREQGKGGVDWYMDRGARKRNIQDTPVG